MSKENEKKQDEVEKFPNKKVEISKKKDANMTIPQLEANVLKFWKKNKVFEKSVDQRSDDNLYVFYDGPPFISGLPHYGHILVSIAKDLIPRYWTMKGKKVERVWGWDAHGLTVENRVQKELGIKNRRDIENYGLEKFTKACYDYTSKTSAEWNWYIDRIGRWVDIDNAYKTIDQSYMESVMWVFKSLYDKGLIYEGVYTSLYCTTCGTPVSNFEIAMDNTYKDVEDPSVTITFKVTTAGKFENVSILAWTTTPWTLPSNRALVVDENSEYVLVEATNEKYVVAEELAGAVFAEIEHKVIDKFKGSELVGLEYAPLYKFYKPNENDFKVYAYEGMVAMTDGTGIVHSAPGFGMIDTEMGRECGLTMMLTVDGEGSVIPGNWEKNPFEGMFYKKANKYIRKDLTDRGLLFKDEKLTHRFPYHDRCDTLLIQRAQSSWFVKVSNLKQKMYETNDPINWVPNHLKDRRFKTGIEQAPDWCISRARFWATPMPVWESEDGDRVVVGSIAELEELSGQKVKDLHRPYIDEITFEKDGKKYTRIKEVLDSWFEAGSMPYAQMHYPFENKKKFEENFPGNFIVEYIAQTRAWFYVMHVLSTALFEANSFENVIATGVLAGDDGRKMSKTYNNYTDPKGVLEDLGGDALRLYFMNSPLMSGGNANFELIEIKTKVKNVLNPLLNSSKFFLIHAKNHKWNPEMAIVSENTLDNWVLARLTQVTQAVSENIEKYTVAPAVQAVEDFADDLSRWYVRRSRDRLSVGDNEALSTLYRVLNEFSKVAAPIIPFMCEHIYQTVVMSFTHFAPGVTQEEADMMDVKESVHLCTFPEASDLAPEQMTLLKTMQNTRDVVSLALAVRAAQKVKVRQPLGKLIVVSQFARESFVQELIMDEVNIKEVAFVNDAKGVKDAYFTDFPKVEEAGFTVYLDTTLTDDLKTEGTARELTRTLQKVRKNLGLSVSDKVTVTYENTNKNKKAIKAYGDEIKKKVNATELVAGIETSLAVC